MDEEKQRRGFACGTNAADAARKNHEMGTAHRWTSTTAREAQRIAQERRDRTDRRTAPREHPDRRQNV